MKAAIMQPYLLPYIGYFQLIAAADVFVVYDNIKYTKKGWINRNRYLLNGADATFSVPLRKDSDLLDVRQRAMAADFNRAKLLGQLREAYRKAPYFAATFPLVEEVLAGDGANLFDFLHRSIVLVCGHLGIATRIVVSSTLDIDHSLQAADKVLALCRAAGADAYINPIGGVELYSKDDFAAEGIELSFLKSRPIEYLQFGAAFVPWLSIVDVMMFNDPDRIRHLLSEYDLV
jgi:hypothetical protein